jgi:hypothetical protein
MLGEHGYQPIVNSNAVQTLKSDKGNNGPAIGNVYLIEKLYYALR